MVPEIGSRVWFPKLVPESGPREMAVSHSPTLLRRRGGGPTIDGGIQFGYSIQFPRFAPPHLINQTEVESHPNQSRDLLHIPLGDSQTEQRPATKTNNGASSMKKVLCDSHFLTFTFQREWEREMSGQRRVTTFYRTKNEEETGAICGAWAPPHHDHVMQNPSSPFVLLGREDSITVREYDFPFVHTVSIPLINATPSQCMSGQLGFCNSIF